jgi:hypothetical protein
MKGNYCIVITANSKLHVHLEGDVREEALLIPMLSTWIKSKYLMI